MKLLSGDNELLMQAAINRVENGESARAVAKTLGLQHASLSRRVKKQQYDVPRVSNQTKLSADTEEFVCDWIIAEEAAGKAPNARQLLAFVALLLRQQGRPDHIGHQWIERFRKRHSNTIKVKKNRLISFRKIMTSRIDEVEKWFQRLDTIIKARDIKPCNIWNMDETGLQQGFQSNSKVFGSILTTSIDKPSNTDTEWITIVECIGAEGDHIKPGVIFSGKLIWTDSTGDHPPDWLFGASLSGFSNHFMMNSWFRQAFLPETAPGGSEWRLLIIDNHGSHKDAEFSQMAFANKVQLFFLPKNTSHELQPLDVGCFSPLKTEYRHQIEDLNIYDITASGSKRRFINAYKEASNKAFTAMNVRSGFSHSGIWPFRPNKVVERIQPPPPFTPCHAFTTSPTVLSPYCSDI
jgi:4-hydroxybenzoate polyprenyltransferase